MIVNAGNWLGNCQGITPTPTPTPTGTPSCTRGGKMKRPWPMHDATRPQSRLAPTSMPSPGLMLRPITPLLTSASTAAVGRPWPYPLPHAQSRGTAVGTNIYVPGGFNSISSGGPLDTMQIYNTATNTWSSGATMPGTRGGVATATFNGMVYIIAGYTTPFPPSPTRCSSITRVRTVTPWGQRCRWDRATSQVYCSMVKSM